MVDETHKHAYLIMVHKSLCQVEKLCHLLDDRRNDLYIHVDARTPNFDMWKMRLMAAVHSSKIFFVPRVIISFFGGGVSQIRAELALLRTATEYSLDRDKAYRYYHLISGADLPLKTQDEIHAFFEHHQGQEFVHLGTASYQEEIQERVRYWYLWQELIGRGHGMLSQTLHAMQKVFLEIQRALRVNINRDNPIQRFYAGANWFSITDAFARYIVDHEQWVLDTFCKGKNVDELFVQTLLMNSSFANHRFLPVAFDENYQSIMRDIDWHRGSPYIWRTSDYDELMKFEFLFARKLVVPELLRTLVFARPCGGDQFAAGTVSPSLDMSR